MPALKGRYNFYYRGLKLTVTKDYLESRLVQHWPFDQWGVWTDQYFLDYFDQEATTEVHDIRRAACEVALGKKN